MEKHSKIYLLENDQHIGFRYNYERAVLEYVSKVDIEFDEDDNLIEVELPDWKVIDSTGLNRENWEENPEYWIEQYHANIKAETEFEMKFL